MKGDTMKGQSSKRVEWRGLGAMAEFWTATQEILQGSDPMVRKPKVRDRVPLTPGSRPIPPLDSFFKDCDPSRPLTADLSPSRSSRRTY